MVDAVKNFTINNAKYYESNTATSSDAQGDITNNPDTVTNTSNGNETVTRTGNNNFEQELLSDGTIPVVVMTMSPGSDQRIEQIVIAPQMLLIPATKEVVANAALGGT